MDLGIQWYSDIPTQSAAFLADTSTCCAGLSGAANVRFVGRKWFIDAEQKCWLMLIDPGSSSVSMRLGLAHLEVAYIMLHRYLLSCYPTLHELDQFTAALFIALSQRLRRSVTTSWPLVLFGENGWRYVEVSYICKCGPSYPIITTNHMNNEHIRTGTTLTWYSVCLRSHLANEMTHLMHHTMW